MLCHILKKIYFSRLFNFTPSRGEVEHKQQLAYNFQVVRMGVNMNIGMDSYGNFR